MSVGRGLACVTVAAVGWGTAGATAALAFDSSGLGPVALTFWRMAGGLVLLLAVRALLPRRTGPARPQEPARHRVARVLITGLGLTVFQAAYFGAVAGTGTAVGTVITQGAAPVVVALGGRLLMGERLGVGGGVAVAGALAGLAVLMLGGAGTDAVRPLGAAMGLLSAAGYAVVTLYGRYLGRRGRGADAFTTTLTSFAVGTVSLLPLAAAEGLWPRAEGLGRTLGLMAYLVAVPTTLSYGLFFAGLAAVRATTVTVITLLEPVTAAAVAVGLLGERLTAPTLLGTAVLLGAVAALAVAETRGAPAAVPVEPALASAGPAAAPVEPACAARPVEREGAAQRSARPVR
ncbi:DMT family transporter [Streptomyces griseocarneus]|uniref:DMT family transporter n=1 Tax=Streptomyces griseocarneus TaxID=51201 RepID=UPI00167EAF1D|nr:DMT family transporter [Streptomyces griseocarneus]MBZ6476369.1 DMT family transporter [Streptomyces griseocarneus]